MGANAMKCTRFNAAFRWMAFFLISNAGCVLGQTNDQVELDGHALKCFHLSGPLWALLRYDNSALSLQDVDNLVDAHLVNGHSVWTALLDASQQLGCPLRRIRSLGIANCRPPCLLVVHRDNGGSVEHELLLAGFRDDSVVAVYWFRDLGGWKVMSFEELEPHYTGWTIEIVRQRQVMNYFVVSVCCFLGVFVVWCAVKFFKWGPGVCKRQQSIAKFTCLVVTGSTLISSGCHGDPNGSLSAPTFRFSAKTIDLGLVEQNEMRTFEVTLIDSGGRTWDGTFEVDCGCIQMPTIRLRSRMTIGHQLVLPVQVSTGRQVGPQKHFIRFQGRNEIGSSANMTCEIRYVVSSAPFAEPSQLVMNRLHGEPEWQGEIRVVCPRAADNPVAQLNFAKSRLNNLRVEVLETSTITPAGSRATVDDIFRLKFSTAAGHNEPDDERIEVRFDQPDRSLVLPVTFRARHPIRLDAPGIFLGRCQASSRHHRRLTLINVSDSPISGRFTWSGDGVAAFPSEVALVPGHNAIQVEIESGSEDGRQSAQLTFVADSAELPPLFIEFSWLNKSPDDNTIITR
ncbi:MAG TPA: hypothetical protein PKD54_02175 [Pirellulaceae bacterium]|nr:hypothetical protein [Pirellulaceae bacterium]